MSYENRKRFIVNFLYYCLIAAVAFLVLRFGFRYLSPFIVAFIVAFSMKHVISKTALLLRIKRPFAAVLCVAVFYFTIVGLLAAAGIQALALLQNLFYALPEFYARELAPVATRLLEQIMELLTDIDPALESAAVNLTYQLGENLGAAVSDISVAAVSGISSFLAGVPSLFINTLISVIASFFFAADYYNITYFVLKQLPQKYVVFLYEAEQHAKGAVRKFLKSYSIILLITFSELSLGFFLLGIKRFFMTAGLIAVFDILPVRGTGGILIPWALICFVGGNIPLGAGILILYMIVTIVRNAMEPKIVGDQVGLHPLATLVSMYLGTRLIGFAGLFLFPILLVILKQMRDTGTIKFPK